MVELVLFLTIATSLAWFASEFQTRRWLRLMLGTLAILSSAAISWAVGSLDRLTSNAWFGAATKNLVQNTIQQLEAVNADRVLAELRRLRDNYQPAYESRADYDIFGRRIRATIDRESGPPRPGKPPAGMDTDLTIP